jgi:hypothetical protein
MSTGITLYNSSGVRSVSIEALCVICELQLGRTDSQLTLFRGTIKKTGREIVDRLIKEGMFRKRGDILLLASQLAVHVNDQQMRKDVLQLLVKAWRDPDSQVRQTAISRVKAMGEQGVPQVLECFQDATLREETTADQRLPDMMSEMVKLVNNPDYMDKESLQDLLKWRFSVAERKPVKFENSQPSDLIPGQATIINQ